MVVVNFAEISVKKKVKGKSWKNISSSDKDELLYEVCKKLYLIDENTPYQ